jgi:tetratricopeptide (TPR) repeat protein
MKLPIRPFIIAILLAPAAVIAADTPPPKPEPKDAVIEQARDAIARQDWSGAQRLLKGGVAENPRSADYHNLYAYSVRNGASPDMNLVFKHYNQALSLDPKHRGAHEYIGEAYLMVGNLPKAKEHLAQLDRLCFFSCREYSDLKDAIASHEKKVASR